MYEIVKKQLENAVQADSKVLLAFSGGVDSRVLLDLLLRYQEEVPFELELFHLNHGIREESDQEELFVLDLARREQLVVHLERADVPQVAGYHKLGIEEAARLVRYQFLEKIMEQEGFDFLALAHHLDDNVETFFLNLARGSGARGLAGMNVLDGKKLRPMLDVTKQQIYQYALEAGLEHVEDQSNQDTVYKRNLLRVQIIPYLKKQFDAHLDEHVAQAMHLLQSDEDYFEQALSGFTGDCYELEALRSMHPAMLSRLVRKILREHGALRDVSAGRLSEVLDLIRSSTSSEVHFGDLILSVEQTKLMVRNKDELRSVETQELNMGDNHVTGGRIHLSLEEEPSGDLCIPQSVIQGKLRLRARGTGDRIAIGPTEHKPLKNYFIDEKIPRSLRDSIPLLTDEKRVFWIIGYRKAYIPKRSGPYVCIRFTKTGK